MNDRVALILLFALGVLPLGFGLFSDCFNFALAFSVRRAERERRHQRHISPIVLAPVLFNAFGWMMICLLLRLAWFWFVPVLLGFVLIHLIGLGAWRR